MTEMTGKQLPWPRVCGYCRAEVEHDDATHHWDRGFVSRCRLRQARQRKAS